MYAVYYVIALVAAFLLGDFLGKRLYNRRRHADKQCPPNRSAIQSSIEIGKFLKQRRGAFIDGPRLKGFMDGMRKSAFYEGGHPALVHFIRVCHLYGCEVEIRQVTEDRTKVHKTDDELITFMRPKFYEEQEYVV